MKHKNTQPLYIFNRENPQNSEPQNGPRSGLDYIALENIVFNQIIEKPFGHFTIKSITTFFFILCDQQHSETSTPETSKLSTSTAKVSTSLRPMVEGQFQCQLYPIPLKLKCDGTTHCIPDGSDEQDCLEAPTISYPTSIPSIRAPTNHKKLKVEFQNNKKSAWKSKKDIRKL